MSKVNFKKYDLNTCVSDERKVIGQAIFDLRPNLPLTAGKGTKLLRAPLRPDAMPFLRALCPDMLRISLGYDTLRNRLVVHVEQALIWNARGRFEGAEKGAWVCSILLRRASL